jgi:hypothetical protein
MSALYRKAKGEFFMTDLDKALADILVIRSHIAAGAAFRGFGPAAIAATGVLAIAAAVLQTIWLKDAAADPLAFLAGWVATAVLAAGIVGAEMRGRSRRLHSRLADAMIYNAIAQFLPAVAAGACLAAVLIRFAPEALWMLPGLWQILVSLGIFASVRSLQTAVSYAGAWYFVAGLGVLMYAGQTHTLAPWMMGAPFAIGQFLLAIVMHHAFGGQDDED